MRDDFDKKAMDEKIRLNVEKGIPVKKIYIMLKEEQLEHCQAISIKEARNAELQDQIEYIEEQYGNTI